MTAIAKTGILWFFILKVFIINGSLNIKHRGIITTQLMTRIARIKSQMTSGIRSWKISYKYIKSRPSEHMKVMINMDLGSIPLIILSIRYLVTI